MAASPTVGRGPSGKKTAGLPRTKPADGSCVVAVRAPYCPSPRPVRAKVGMAWSAAGIQFTKRFEGISSLPLGRASAMPHRGPGSFNGEPIPGPCLLPSSRPCASSRAWPSAPSPLSLGHF
jgi:hypothetical protein